MIKKELLEGRKRVLSASGKMPLTKLIRAQTPCRQNLSWRLGERKQIKFVQPQRRYQSRKISSTTCPQWLSCSSMVMLPPWKTCMSFKILWCKGNGGHQTGIGCGHGHQWSWLVFKRHSWLHTFMEDLARVHRGPPGNARHKILGEGMRRRAEEKAYSSFHTCTKSWREPAGTLSLLWLLKLPDEAQRAEWAPLQILHGAEPSSRDEGLAWHRMPKGTAWHIKHRVGMWSWVAGSIPAESYSHCIPWISPSHWLEKVTNLRILHCSAGVSQSRGCLVISTDHCTCTYTGHPSSRWAYGYGWVACRGPQCPPAGATSLPELDKSFQPQHVIITPTNTLSWEGAEELWTV